MSRVSPQYTNITRTSQARQVVTRLHKEICIHIKLDLNSPQLADITMPPRLRHNPIPSISLTTNLIVPPYLCLISQSRRFSVTPPVPSQRSEFYDWINGPGVIFKQADDDGPKYISAYDKFTWERKEPERAGPTPSMPFPLNRTFKSMPVLSDQMRELIYIRVEREGRSIRQVSAEFGVSLERVAAVVRLKAVEWRWRSNVS